ncbi:unnamed protein product [Cylindrotheca closterium]|uniref:Uncharacterized protein n=1 Tax=Cylindrotheca closterium TaxID=2856 RepID=A0AAD2FBJ2_9STRA|nr:unnamed protein product [Cylindrotheca closterium]
MGSGSVTVYEMVNEAWALMDVILVDTLNSVEHTVSLSKDGSRVAIGDRWSNDSNHGKGRVFEWDGSSFRKLGDDIYGESRLQTTASGIALSDDGLVVALSIATFVRVFEWSAGSWTKRRLNLDGRSGGRISWDSVALSGDGSIVALGLCERVQVFEWKDTKWIQVGQTLKAASGEGRLGFSVSLSCSGSMLAVGSSGSDRAVSKVYTLADETWVELGGLIGGDYSTRASLSSDGSTFVVGLYSGRSGFFVSVYNLNEPSDTPTSRPIPLAISGPPSVPPSGPRPTDGQTSGTLRPR